MRCLIVGVYLVVATALVAPAWGDDAAIAREVAEKLRYQQEQQKLEGFHITVKVEDGTVWMMGDVADSQQRDLALDVARRVSDVRLVVNDLHFDDLGATEEDAFSPPPEPEPVDFASSIPAPSVAPDPDAEPVPSVEPGPTADDSRRDEQAVMATAHNAFVPPAAAPSGVMRQPRVPMPPPRTVSQPIGTGVGYQAGMRAHPVHVAQLAGNGYGSAASTPAYAPAASAGYCEHCGNGAGGASEGYGYEGYGYQGNGYDGGVDGGVVYDDGSGGGYGGISSGQPQMPNYAWPSYASYPNYGAVTYPRQYSPKAWPYIGPFYPYPQVPLGWRKVSLEWDDGWWMLDFSHK